jgi:N-methylhydantoinase A
VPTREGARTGLPATRGFGDALHVTRGACGRWAGLTEERMKHPVRTDRAPALVPRDRVAAIPERVDGDGDVVRPMDEAAVEQAVRHLTEGKGVEALAVSFLWSFLNPAHERRVRAIVERAAPGTRVTLSSGIAPVPAEFERTSTAVMNACAGRITRECLTALPELLKARGDGGATMVMQGSGGLIPAAEAADRAVGRIECGPPPG